MKKKIDILANKIMRNFIGHNVQEKFKKEILAVGDKAFISYFLDNYPESSSINLLFYLHKTISFYTDEDWKDVITSFKEASSVGHETLAKFLSYHTDATFDFFKKINLNLDAFESLGGFNKFYGNAKNVKLIKLNESYEEVISIEVIKMIDTPKIKELIKRFNLNDIDVQNIIRIGTMKQ